MMSLMNFGPAVKAGSAMSDGVSHSTSNPLLSELQKNIRQIETSGRVDDGEVIASGCPAVDRLLPGGGYRRGVIVEWMAGSLTSRSQRAKQSQRRSMISSGGRGVSLSGGYGADYLALLAAKQACADGGALVIVDLCRQFNPPAAAAMGVDLGNVIVLRPERDEVVSKERQDGFFWAIDQALRCSAVAAVLATLGEVHERWFRRFQLSAESSGAMGLFVRPATLLRQPSWSEVQWHVTGVVKTAEAVRASGREQPVDTQFTLRDSLARPSQQKRSALQQLELKLVRCRGVRTGQRIELEIDTVTGSVRGSGGRSDDEKMSLPVASQLADPATGCGEARA